MFINVEVTHHCAGKAQRCQMTLATEFSYLESFEVQKTIDIPPKEKDRKEPRRPRLAFGGTKPAVEFTITRSRLLVIIMTPHTGLASVWLIYK